MNKKRNNPQPFDLTSRLRVTSVHFWNQVSFKTISFCRFFDTLSFLNSSWTKLAIFIYVNSRIVRNTFLFLALFFTEKYLSGSDFIFLSLYYLYIGITSLCLYNSTGYSHFQDGILYKVTHLFLFITEILYTLPQKNIDNSIYCMLL